MEKKSYKHEWEPYYDWSLANTFRSFLFSARVFYLSRLKPALESFGLLNEKNVREFLLCETMESVFKFICEANPERMKLMKEIAISMGSEIWKPFKENYCEAPDPTDPNFVFYSNSVSRAKGEFRERLLKCIEITPDGSLFTHEEKAHQASLRTPTEQMRMLFDAAETFLETHRSIDPDGKIWPSRLFFYDNEKRRWRANNRNIFDALRERR